MLKVNKIQSRFSDYWSFSSDQNYVDSFALFRVNWKI